MSNNGRMELRFSAGEKNLQMEKWALNGNFFFAANPRGYALG